MVAIRQVSVAKKLSQDSHYNASESICYSQERIQNSSGLEVRKRISRKGCLTAQVRKQGLLLTFWPSRTCRTALDTRSQTPNHPVGREQPKTRGPSRGILLWSSQPAAEPFEGLTHTRCKPSSLLSINGASQASIKLQKLTMAKKHRHRY